MSNTRSGVTCPECGEQVGAQRIWEKEGRWRFRRVRRHFIRGVECPGTDRFIRPKHMREVLLRSAPPMPRGARLPADGPGPSTTSPTTRATTSPATRATTTSTTRRRTP